MQIRFLFTIFYLLIYFGNLILAQNGRQLFSWGGNTNGQLGIGNQVDQHSPVNVADSFFANVSQIQSGYAHVLALLGNGSVYAWGWNSDGQLGDNTTNQQTSPSVVWGLSNVVQISTGYSFSLALLANGSVFSWGYDTDGELGNNKTTDVYLPKKVGGILPIVTQMSAGYYHTLALTESGSVYSWGLNANGQLGIGTNVTQENLPVLVSGLSNVVSVAGGGYHSLAITSGGSLYTWGYNSFGQLGDGTSVDKYSPVLISGISNVQQVSGGNAFSFALLTNGSVYSWGQNNYGQLGTGNLFNNVVPTLVPGLSNVAQIVAGNYFALAVYFNGSVSSWGYNSNGQLGDGTSGNQQDSPVLISGLTNILQATAGGSQALAFSVPVLPSHTTAQQTTAPEQTTVQAQTTVQEQTTVQQQTTQQQQTYTTGQNAPSTTAQNQQTTQQSHVSLANNLAFSFVGILVLTIIGLF